MRRLGFIHFACLLAVCGVNHAAATEADDTRAWQGTWKLVSCMANGESQTADMKWIVNGDRLKGIYEIQGNSLKVCYDLKGQRYPKSFDAGRGSAQVLYQFQRERRD